MVDSHSHCTPDPRKVDQMTDPDLTEEARGKRSEMVSVLIQLLPRESLQWIVDQLNDHLDRPWPRVGAINRATLEELNEHGWQARESVEQ